MVLTIRFHFIFLQLKLILFLLHNWLIKLRWPIRFYVEYCLFLSIPSWDLLLNFSLYFNRWIPWITLNNRTPFIVNALVLSNVVKYVYVLLIFFGWIFLFWLLIHIGVLVGLNIQVLNWGSVNTSSGMPSCWTKRLCAWTHIEECAMFVESKVSIRSPSFFLGKVLRYYKLSCCLNDCLSSWPVWYQFFVLLRLSFMLFVLFSLNWWLGIVNLPKHAYVFINLLFEFIFSMNKIERSTPRRCWVHPLNAWRKLFCPWVLNACKINEDLFGLCIVSNTTRLASSSYHSDKLIVLILLVAHHTIRATTGRCTEKDVAMIYSCLILLFQNTKVEQIIVLIFPILFYWLTFLALFFLDSRCHLFSGSHIFSTLLDTFEQAGSFDVVNTLPYCQHSIAVQGAPTLLLCWTTSLLYPTCSNQARIKSLPRTHRKTVGTNSRWDKSTRVPTSQLQYLNDKLIIFGFYFSLFILLLMIVTVSQVVELLRLRHFVVNSALDVKQCPEMALILWVVAIRMV